MRQLFLSHPLLIIGIIICNIVLSLWCVYQDPVINNDGVTYLAIAQYFLDGQWAAAFDYYSWPFYSLFIAATAKLFFLDVESATYLLNVVFATSITLAFVCIVGELSDNNQRIIIIAALVILFFPSISKYRSYIIRDFGYLSFYLWSLFSIFRFCNTLHKKHLLSWLFFAGISCLFRFEGIVFILVAPYFLILFGAKKLPHRRKILFFASIAIFTAAAAVLFWYINDKYNDMIAQSTEGVKTVGDLFFSNIKQQLGQQTLTPMSYIKVVISSTGDVTYELIRRMAILYFFFSIFTYIKDWGLNKALLRRVWLVYFIVNILLLIGFSTYNSFLVSRYTMASVLTLLILAPFAIDRLITVVNIRKQCFAKAAAIFSFLLLALASINGLNVATNKKYLKEAGQWIADNASDGHSVYSNNKLISYYAGVNANTLLNTLYDEQRLRQMFRSHQLHAYDYIAFSGNNEARSQSVLRQTLSYHFGRPVKMFYASKKRQFVFIYQVKKTSQKS